MSLENKKDFQCATHVEEPLMLGTHYFTLTTTSHEQENRRKKMFNSMLFEIIAQASNFAGAIGGIIAAIGVLRVLATQKRALEHVEISLQLEGEDSAIALPLEMLRKDISRAELLGRLGMALKNQGQRFSLKALSTPAFMQSVNEVVEGKTSKLVIPCTKEEIEQFAV